MNTIGIPRILLPRNVDMTDWAVVACDQYTSDSAYWQKLEEQVGDKKSTLKLIFPEIYLKDNAPERIKRINQTMEEYLSEGVFEEIDGMVLCKRTTQSGERCGIVLAIDLEDYSFQKGTKALIRSTEATILERIPPRVEIRKNAPIELPHIMLLYDDRQNKVLNEVVTGKKLYDFDLNMGGGHITGYQIDNAAEVIDAFYGLLDDDVLIKKYGTAERLLFAVGDGNHSLATAKTCWENIKPTLTEEQRACHPARFALCEAVNIYDTALHFEPIHRLIKTKQPEKLLSMLSFEGLQTAYTVVNGKKQPIAFDEDIPRGIAKLDSIIASFLADYGGEVDYIHGEEELNAFSSQGVGVMLPAIPKGDFFRLIISGGNLPRKTFSMGEGNEKRYYIEAKKIR